MIVEKISDDCTWKITDDGTLVISPAEGELGHLNCGGRMWPWRRETFKRVRLEGHIIAGKDTSYMFLNNYDLEDVSGLENLDTSGVENMAGMFKGCRALEDISALKNWNTHNVKKMAYMFLNCAALGDISALADWDTSNVTDMRVVFSRCKTLRDISALKNWDTGNVVDMEDIFRNCTALEDASVLAGWNTAGARYMNSMFRNCIYLRNISGLENWDISSILNMDLMFANCVSLKSHKTLLEKWRQKNNNSRYGGDRTVSPERLFPNINDPMTCPRTGSFTGWKKCNDAKIVELLIPADAKRSSSIGRECRCDKAVVMEIYDKNGQSVETAVSWYDDQFVYYRGKTVSVPNFDEDRFDECAPGIHFFMTRSEAESWPLR